MRLFDFNYAAVAAALMPLLPLVFQVTGILLLVLFAYIVWPALAILLTGLFVLVIGISFERVSGAAKGANAGPQRVSL